MAKFPQAPKKITSNCLLYEQSSLCELWQIAFKDIQIHTMMFFDTVSWLLSLALKSNLEGSTAEQCTETHEDIQKEIQNSNSTIERAFPPSILKSRCHHLELQITREVEDYFIRHWPFPDENAVQKFRAAGFSRVTCCYFPEALDDRIVLAAQLLTLLFLVDGKHLSFQALKLNARVDSCQTCLKICRSKMVELTITSSYRSVEVNCHLSLMLLLRPSLMICGGTCEHATKSSRTRS